MTATAILEPEAEAPLEIERRRSVPSPEEFRATYVHGSRPVVIEGGISAWPAMGAWTPESLAAKVGAREIMVQSSPTGIFGLDPVRGGPRYAEVDTTLGDYVERLMEAEGDTRYYVQRINIPEKLPELMEDIALPDYVDAGLVYLINLWLGPAGNVTTLHYDTPNNFLAQISGRKRLKMFAPSDTPRLYPCRSKAYNMSQVNLEAPDLGRFPRFAGTRPYETEIGPGDLLFIPTFWWHQVYSLTAGISVNIWWLPLWRQLLRSRRQVLDNVPDIARELRKRAAHRLKGAA
jgi:hypothetical protein